MSVKLPRFATRAAMIAAVVMASSFSVATQASAVEFSVDFYFFEVSHEVCVTNGQGVKTCQVVNLTSEGAAKSPAGTLWLDAL
jgi:hypothetical protein